MPQADAVSTKMELLGEVHALTALVRAVNLIIRGENLNALDIHDPFASGGLTPSSLQDAIHSIQQVAWQAERLAGEIAERLDELSVAGERFASVKGGAA